MILDNAGDRLISYLEKRYEEVFNIKRAEMTDEGYEVYASCAHFPNEDIIARIPDVRDDCAITDNFLTVFFKSRAKEIFTEVSNNFIGNFKLYISHSSFLMSDKWSKASDIKKLLNTSEIIMPFSVILPPEADSADHIAVAGRAIADTLTEMKIYQIFNMYMMKSAEDYREIDDINYVSYIQDDSKLSYGMCF